MKKQENTWMESAMIEFQFVVNNYLLPIVDTRGKLKIEKVNTNNTKLVLFDKDKDGKSVIKFFPCIGKSSPSLYYCEIGTYSTSSMQKKLTRLLKEMLKVMEFCCVDGKIRKQRDYGTDKARKDSFKRHSLNIAFEYGICSFLSRGYNDATTLYSILCKMTEWAGKTYEGEKVPFGIVIDFDHKVTSNEISYLEFLDNDNSAVFSDGIFSGILLDKTGRLDSFITRKTDLRYGETNQKIFVPYQYTDIAKHCTKNSIGIIVLISGEILLVQNQSICFAKRGGKWVSFDWDRVYVNLRPYFIHNEQTTKIDQALIMEKIKTIYCTILDVSFSHTGGCLSIIHPSSPKKQIDNIIKERFDLHTTDGKFEKNSNISSESKQKITVLKHLISDSSNNETSFFELDSPLRKEIMSLDGATVVKLDGSFYCAGSIVAVHGGSDGGGRTAASKKLAELGVGIKVSEDGYIKAFGKPLNGEKGRIIPLFEIT